MMETKAFEIRDKGTFIPVITIQLRDASAFFKEEREAREHYLMRRAGFNLTEEPFAVLLVRMDADGSARQASCDPYSWGGRTFPVAHKYIEENWNDLKSGDVVDVEFILGESSKPKTSERESFPL